MVESATLYSQPIDDKPFVLLNELKKGKYELCSSMELRSFIRFTEIGESCWLSAVDMDPNAKISCKKYSHLDDTWEVEISTLNLDISLKTTRYKMSKVFLQIGAKGENSAITELVTKMVRRLGRQPIDMYDYKKFTEVTGVADREVADVWLKYTKAEDGAGAKMILTLHVQPSSDNPFLVLADLKKGKYTSCSAYELRSYIKFTDVGEKLYNIARSLDPNARIQCTNYSHIDESWNVVISFLGATALIKATKYKQLGKFFATTYLSIELTGTEMELTKYAGALAKEFSECPCKFTDAARFEERSGISVSEAEKEWSGVLAFNKYDVKRKNIKKRASGEINVAMPVAEKVDGTNGGKTEMQNGARDEEVSSEKAENANAKPHANADVSEVKRDETAVEEKPKAMPETKAEAHEIILEEKPVEEKPEPSLEKNVESSDAKHEEKPVEEKPEPSLEKNVESSDAKHEEKPVEEKHEPSLEKNVESPDAKHEEKPVEEKPEPSLENNVESPDVKHEEKPVEEKPERSSKPNGEVPEVKLVETPVEKPNAKPAEAKVPENEQKTIVIGASGELVVDEKPGKDPKTEMIDDYVSKFGIQKEVAQKLYDGGYKSYAELKKASIVRLAMAGVDPAVAMGILDKVRKM